MYNFVFLFDMYNILSKSRGTTATFAGPLRGRCNAAEPLRAPCDHTAGQTTGRQSFVAVRRPRRPDSPLRTTTLRPCRRQVRERHRALAKRRARRRPRLRAIWHSAKTVSTCSWRLSSGPAADRHFIPPRSSPRPIRWPSTRPRR